MFGKSVANPLPIRRDSSYLKYMQIVRQIPRAPSLRWFKPTESGHAGHERGNHAGIYLSRGPPIRDLIGLDGYSCRSHTLCKNLADQEGMRMARWLNAYASLIVCRERRRRPR